MKAIWHNVILAESDKTKIVEDKHYFPPDSINSEYFLLSDTHSQSPFGKASYFDVQVGDHRKADAALFYPNPDANSSEIKNHVTFLKEIEIKE
ncbi:DUF427 domain-containing protein [Salinimicrobium flavum]|uniref:DUF427 domain-containing protein n=1 Tax=Salinimicrobium flavum TaxID=1737065 RepID=A0ABW5ISH3_9FLAO